MRSLLHRLKATAVRTPVLRRAVAVWTGLWFPGSRDYWEQRYRRRGTSGHGSRGRIAEEKAQVIDRLIAEREIGSVIDFGCGDGVVAALLHCPRYLGLDVSPTAIERCRSTLGDHPHRNFQVYDPDADPPGSERRGDLAMSLDVIYHLTEDRTFDRYMSHLFAAGQHFVLIYSTVRDEPSVVAHVRHRDFRGWVERHQEEWRLEQVIPMPGHECDFYLYAKCAPPDRPDAPR